MIGKTGKRINGLSCRKTYTKGGRTLTQFDMKKLVPGLSLTSRRDRLERWVRTPGYTYEHLTRPVQKRGGKGQATDEWKKLAA